MPTRTLTQTTAIDPAGRLHGFAGEPERASHGRRYLFFTNECVGLGHLRRALTLARALGDRDSRANGLIVTGSALTPGTRLPERVDTVKLPALGRDPDGRHGAGSLELALDHVHELRAGLALAAARSFAPDVAIVDKTPVGLAGELLPTLTALRAGGCRIVLGLRDIDDDPERVRARWGQPAVRAAIERFYDLVLVYGPPGSPSALDCMGWHDFAVPVEHVGYVGTPLGAARPDGLPDGYVLVTAGGGADGHELLAAYLDALRLAPLPFPSVLVTGPLMPQACVADLRARCEGLDVQLFEVRADMEAVISGARAVVSMAGYNTVSELLRAGKRALLVPRTRPSAEQLVRARALADAGLADLLHPDELAPGALRPALDRLLDPGRPTPSGIDADGGPRAARLLHQLARTRAPRRSAADPWLAAVKPV